jgi:dienelactone hydrolase
MSPPPNRLRRIPTTHRSAGTGWPEHQARGTGEPASIVGVIRELMGRAAHWTIDARRIFVAGLSAGGAMTAILAAVYPDLFAAVAVHSGLSYRAAASLGAAFDAMVRGGDDPSGQSRAAHASIGHLAPRPKHGRPRQRRRHRRPRQRRPILEQSMTANRLAAPEICDFEITRPTTTSRGQVNDGHAYTRSPMDRPPRRPDARAPEGRRTRHAGPAARPAAPTPTPETRRDGGDLALLRAGHRRPAGRLTRRALGHAAVGRNRTSHRARGAGPASARPRPGPNVPPA